MHKIEIDVIEPKLLQTGIKGTLDSVGREVLVPDLGRDVQILARHTGGGDRGADRVLVGVHLRGVDVAIAERKRAFDRGTA